MAADVTSSTSGMHVNLSGNLTSSAGTSGTTTDTLTVVSMPLFNKSFAPDEIASGGISTLTFTIDNTANATPVTGLDFIDSLPAGVTVAPTPNVTNTCTGGTVTAAAGTSTFSYNGGTGMVGGTDTCMVSADVTSSTIGMHVNTSGDLTSSAGNSGTATDTLTVVSTPGFSKSFGPDTIATGGVSTLTFTFNNSANATPVTGLEFIDGLPSGMFVAATPTLTNTCPGGTLTAVPGADTFSFAGGTLGAGASCGLTFDVTSSIEGTFVNTTGDLTSSAGNSGTATDTLTVTDPDTTFSIPTATGSGTVTGNISGGGSSCTIGTASATTAAAVAGSGPPGVAFPHGLVAFRFDDCDTGAVVTVTLTFPAPLPAGTQYWKYGPTAADPSPHWYVLPAMFAGAQVTFTLTDGGLGDHDLTPNGTIVDPGGPSSTAVPTTPLWALAILALVMLMAARLALRLRLRST